MDNEQPEPNYHLSVMLNGVLADDESDNEFDDNDNVSVPYVS